MTLLVMQQGGDGGGQGADFGKSSPVGLLILILFLIAVALLVRSMTKHLKRVPASFDAPDQPRPGGTDADERPAPAERSPEPARETHRRAREVHGRAREVHERASTDEPD